MKSLVGVLIQGLLVLRQMRDEMAVQTLVLEKIASSLQSDELAGLILTPGTPALQ